MNDSSRTSSSRRLRSRKTGLLLGVVGLGLIGFGAWKALNPGEEESPYRFGRVEMGDIEDVVTATGTLEPRDYVDVGAQVSGQIKKLFVEVGDVVKVGQVLAEIDAEQAQARVDANRASLLSAKISLETQQNNLERARRDFQRQENMWAEKATTEEQYQNALTAYENAKRDIQRSEASIAQQEANMRIEARNLQYTQITAPIEGTIMSIAQREGQTVNASQSVPNVMRIANLGTMTVRADVSEADVGKLYEGMQVYFNTLGAGQNRRWYATLKRIEPSPKNQQGVILYPALFDVENEITERGATLKPQSTAQVFFVAAEARNVLMVPVAALTLGQQISRELAAKERERDGNGERRPGGPPGGAGPAMAGNVTPPANAGSASATVEPAPAGVAGAGATADAGGPPGGDRQGGFGQRGNGGPGGFGGQRGNGGPGGFGGQRGGGGAGGFAQMSPEEREQMMARFREGGGPGGFGGGGGFRGMGGGGGGAGPTQQRRGIVMVKKADGSLEPRQVVVGVSDRVHGQVIEGLTDGEEVVVGKAETEPQTGPTSNNNNNNNNNNFRGNQGGFPGGGNFGGGNRPFR